MMEKKTYTPEEVTAIVAGALRRHREHGAVTHAELLETAAELGIGRTAVEESVRLLATEHDLDEAKRKWLARQRREFRDHVVAYVIVGAFLYFVDMITSGGVWYYWALLGWGVGVAFHAYAVFFPDPEQVEKGARDILARQYAKRLPETPGELPSD